MSAPKNWKHNIYSCLEQQKFIVSVVISELRKMGYQLTRVISELNGSTTKFEIGWITEHDYLKKDIVLLH